MAYPTQQKTSVGSRNDHDVTLPQQNLYQQQIQPNTTHQVNSVYQQQPPLQQQSKHSVGSRQTEPMSQPTQSSHYVQGNFQNLPPPQTPYGMQRVVTPQPNFQNQSPQTSYGQAPYGMQRVVTPQPNFQTQSPQTPYGMQHVVTQEDLKPQYQAYPTTMEPYQQPQPNQTTQTKFSVGSRK